MTVAQENLEWEAQRQARIEKILSSVHRPLYEQYHDPKKLNNLFANQSEEQIKVWFEQTDRNKNNLLMYILTNANHSKLESLNVLLAHMPETSMQKLFEQEISYRNT